MSSISDGSTDPLLARFKILEESVEKLHRENRTLKSKLQSFNTLSTFYHEARQQIRNLNTQLATKDKIIQGLKATQGTTDGEGHQVDPSKSLVESLLDQLNKVKANLKETERTSQEKAEALNKEVQRLNQQLEEKDKQLQQIVSQPQHEKEMEICRLQRTLAEKERVQATSEVLCRSLSDETHQLRRKLASTAEMCQQLVKVLEETHRNENRNLEEINMERPSKIQHTDSDDTISKLEEENRLLKQKITRVEDLNAKWQKYDASREEYVKGLHAQLKEMKARNEQQKTLHTTHTHAEMVQKEIVRLNNLLEEKMKEHTKLKQEVEDLANARIADGERIQMLEQQLLVYKDDFTSERTDRERAQCRIQELMEEISCLKCKTRRQGEREDAGIFQFGNKNKMYIQKNVTDLQRGNGSESAEARRQIAQVEQQEGPAQKRSSTERRGQDDLQCPRCLRFFQDKLGDTFLEHIAECCQ
ncbi:TNFAIP3-interacting protein 2 [Discoglossus pictus]